jgi:hypothetical protein
MIRRLLLRCAPVAAVAVVAVVGARIAGLDGPHGTALGCALVAVGLLVALRPPAPDAIDTAPGETTRPGGRRDVDELAWAMLERGTRVRTIVLDRVRATARPRLAAHGLDPLRAEDAGDIQRLLGPVAWSVLRPDPQGPVLPGALDATLSALEHLDAADRTGAPGADRPNRTSHAG